MLRRWNCVATLAVVTLSVIHCEQFNSIRSQNESRADSCPCLPVEICPRIFGANPDDAKYLGEVKKCDDENLVRCCGASRSFVIGTTQGPNEEPLTTQVPVPDIFSRIGADDLHENEIPDVESEVELSSTTLSDADQNTEVPSVETLDNLANFQHLNGEIGEEAAGSESITKTSREDIQRSFDSNKGNFPQENIAQFLRKSKSQENVHMVFPNTMSGKPKIAPKTMPATNEMTVFDEEMGMDLHLVFSKTTTKPEVEVVEPAVESVEPAVKPVKPAVKPVEPTPRTTLSPSTKKPFYKFPKRQRKYKPTTKATTQSPKEDTKPKPKAVSSRFGVRPTIRVRNFNRSSSPVTLPRTKLSTTTPPAQDEEILQTSDDDSSHQSRFRLFSARYRLNYLRGNTTTATTLPPTPVETTTRQSLPRKHNRRPQRVEETSLSGRPSKINNNLTRVTDANHRSMMSKVRVALEAATAQNQITEIPRSFASVEMNNRVKKIEQAVVNKMINVIAETKSVRRRGDASKNNSRNNRPVTETPIDTHTSRPDRGKKKFELLDIFDETPVVPMSYSDFMLMRTRRTNAKLVDKVEEDGVPIPTTRRSRRRQTTTVRPIEANNETPNLRGRFRMRGRLTLTTLSPPVQTTTESTSISPATTPEITTLTPAQTTLPSTSVNKQQILLQEEASSKLQSESKNEQQNKDLDVEDIVTTVSPPVKENAETLSSEFKPSPLWSITIAEIMDSTDMEPNHAYVLDEQTFENTLRSRRSRNIFEPPAQYLNGFVPVTSLVGPVPLIRSIQKSSKAIVRYNLPMESKERISKN